MPIGKGFESDFAMVFTVRNGKVTAFQEFTDSAAINAAYQVGATV
jgi:ketosteroid isomerase-like protein